MKIRFLLIGTSLSLIPQTINAQCVATQDCTTLGYTETSCSGGSGVKCPFGNKWACFKSESEYEQEFCTKYGFIQTCTGTNQTGGAGKACNGKYNICKCAANLTWNADTKSCEANTANCVIGALYYSDGTCSQDKLSSKTILGVVIYEKSTSENGWIIALKPILGIEWGGWGTDITGLTNCTTVSCLTDIQASCTNTNIITTYGNDSSTYSAAWAAKNYKEGGKTWCLPSGGLLNTLRNSSNFAKVNAGINIAGGTILGDVPSETEYVWSSSEYNSTNAWCLYAEMSDCGMTTNTKISGGDNLTVRPVMAF